LETFRLGGGKYKAWGWKLSGYGVETLRLRGGKSKAWGYGGNFKAWG